MTRVTFVPLDARDQQFGPYDCERFSLTAGRSFCAVMSFGVLRFDLPQATYAMHCEPVTRPKRRKA